MAEPPLFAGADHDKETCELPVVTEVIVGASGTVAGVTEFEAAEATLVPIAFVAVTVNV